MNKTLLVATTDAAASAGLWVDDDASATLIIHAAAGHTAGEYSDVQISHDGVNYQDLYIDSEQKRLHSLNNAVRVDGPGYFRVDKAATTNATGVYACIRD